MKNKMFIFGLSSFWLVTLMSPVFKKYDYGAGWPMVIVFCVLLLAVLWLVRKERAMRGTDITLEKVVVFVFLLFVGLSFVFSETRNVGFPEVMAYFGAFGLYLALAYRENKWMGTFLKVVCLGAVMAAALGFVIFLSREAPPRMIGPFFNIFYASHLWPNAFALFLLIAWPIFLLFLSKSRWWILGLSLVLAALYLTYSRGAYLCFIGQLALLAAYFAKSLAKAEVVRKVGQTVVFVLVIGVSASVMRGMIFENNISLTDRATFQNNEVATSIDERIDFWIGAWELMWERPLVGHGPFSFKYLYQAEKQREFLAIADHPHNVFLKIGAENGAVAFFAFVLFFMFVLAVWISRFRQLESSDKNLSFVVGVSVVGGFAHNLIDYNFNFLANLILIFVLLAFFRSISVPRKASFAKASASKTFVSKTFAVQKKYTRKGGNGFLLWVFGLLVAGVAIFEGVILVATNLSSYPYLREMSFYPRNYYSDMADNALFAGDFGGVESASGKQLSLNPYDSQMYYLLGVARFSAVNPAFDEIKAAEYFKKAISLNPYNDLNYYREYLSALISFGNREDIIKVKDKLLAMLERYEFLVKHNVHFTAYTSNADAAVDIYKILAMYFPPSESKAEPYDPMYGEGNVNKELFQKASALQDTIDGIRASRKN